ncbi:UTP--glucose-1-phosphate uridylyltransferase GalU [Amylibacter sp.]|jgi:UTP--glucose-1-phosphate uridylyltransferase|nr:UTP--glucose-1-phosphate uridylyltransferase GalU [Amylibacter sp.]MDC1532088.1 UTP--glucose-1-phosphate uridylyltransferase GalU [Amylibacter sp.]
MINKINKAVFPVAGFGTRFLPATKAMPKELLPIINKPLIQYAVEEAIRAGIDTLIFITGRNKRAIEDHFDSNPELEAELFSKGDTDQVRMVRNILPPGVECIFVRQPKQLGLGHAILCSERAVGNEPFAVLLADDFLISDGKGITNDLIKGHEKTGKAQLSVMQVDGPDISKYGVVEHDNLSGAVAGLIEKPEYKNAPSKLASIGRYVLNPDIFDILRNQSFGSGGEIQLADAINSQAKAGKVEALSLNGRRFDCGSVRGYIDAIMYASEGYYNDKN